MISSVRRPSSSGGIALEPVVSTAFGTGASAVLMSSLIGDALCEDALRLDESVREAVDLGLGVVHAKRSAAGRRHAVARKQRHHAVRAGPHRNASAVDDRGDIVRMSAFQ